MEEAISTDFETKSNDLYSIISGTKYFSTWQLFLHISHRTFLKPIHSSVINNSKLSDENPSLEEF